MNDPKFQAHLATLRDKYEVVYQWVNEQPGVSDDFVQVPIESLQQLLYPPYQESENTRLRSALQLIADCGGGDPTPDVPNMPAHCSGSWCAEQARAALEEKE